MKYRDPSIRSCTGVRPPIVRQAPKPTTQRRAYYAGTVQFDPRPTESKGRVLPGGLPPVAYRTPWRRASDTGKGAREPFNSQQSKGEYYATLKYIQQWE